MEATDKTNTVDDTVDRLRSGAHEAVEKQPMQALRRQKCWVKKANN
jgi:hypothetical protein